MISQSEQQQQQMWKQQAMSQSLIEITSRASTPHGLYKGFSSQIIKILMSNSATNSDLIVQPAFFRICNAVFTAHELIGTFSRPENGPANTTPQVFCRLHNSTPSHLFLPQNKVLPILKLPSPIIS
ncbi:hypothetical protein V6N13_038883 [Hibiscus sabdariffa]